MSNPSQTTVPPTTTAIILAAGKGTRMGSDLAKVLHPLAGRPLVMHVLDTCLELKVTQKVVVVGHQRDKVELMVAPWLPTCVLQDRQLGTGQRDFVQFADKMEQHQLGGIEHGGCLTQITHICSRTGARANESSENRLPRFCSYDFQHGFNRADQLRDACGPHNRNHGQNVRRGTKMSFGSVNLACALVH